MAEEAPAAAAAGPSKAQAKPAKKRTAASKAKKTSPNIAEAVLEAVKGNKDRKGTSMAVIKKIIAGMGIDMEKSNKRVNSAVCRLVVNGDLIQVKGAGASGSFKVPKQADTKTKVVKKVSKKSPAKKPTAKKPAAAKKVAKPKKATTPKKKAPAKSPKKAKKPAAKKSPAKKTAPKKTARKPPTNRASPKKATSKRAKK